MGLPDEDLPPHPGPRPEPFEFPFAEADAAVSAMDGLAGELGGLVATHETAATEARVDFEGESRTQFDAGFEELVGRVEDAKRAVEDAQGQLEDDIAEARRRREASLDAIAAWESDKRAYDDARAARTGS